MSAKHGTLRLLMNIVIDQRINQAKDLNITIVGTQMLVGIQYGATQQILKKGGVIVSQQKMKLMA